MTEEPKKKQTTWKRIFLFVGVIILMYALGTVVSVYMTYEDQDARAKLLPVINPVDVNASMVDESLRLKGLNHRIGDFSLTNQNGEDVTQEFIKDKIFVVEYFFTTCGSICPIMNEQMQRVQERFKNSSDLKILSHTVWPEVDSVAQMKKYALEHGADDEMWQFLTGSKDELYRMARKNYFTLKPAEVEGQGDGDSDFIHTNNFVLVDKDKKIRGYYDGTNPEDVDNMMKHIQNLIDGTAG